MLSSLLFSNVFSISEKGLDAASRRQSVISNNLANVDTPGFKRSEVSFEDELLKALGGSDEIAGTLTNSKHIPIGRKSLASVQPQVNLVEDTALRNDGNNVDIDEEMAKLAMNSLRYNAITQQISWEFSTLKSAIKEGR